MAAAMGKGFIDNVPSLTQYIPGKVGQISRDYLKSTRYNDPTLRNLHTVGSFIPLGGMASKIPLGKVGSLNQIGRGALTKAGLTNLVHPGKSILNKIPGAIGNLPGVKQAGGWWNKGRNIRVPGENRASWFGKAGLLADDAAQKGVSDAAFAGREPVSRLTKLVGRPDQAFNPFRSAVKGGPWSGPTPAVRQAFERPVRTAATLAGIGVGAGAVAGQTMKAIGKFMPAEVKGKTGSELLKTDWAQGILERTTEDPDSWQNQYLRRELLNLTEPAREYADNLKGIQGWIGGIQSDKLERRLEAGNLTGAAKTITGTVDLAERYGGRIPTATQWAQGKLGQAGDLLNNQRPRSVRQVLGFDRERKVDTARQLDTAYSRGSKGRQAFQEYDINKIGNTTANEYLESGSAAYDEDMLVDFWNRQNQLNAAADQRLLDIQNDRSLYNTMLQNIESDSQTYSDELARIQPYGQQYSDELARIQPYGKQYSDELARLQPFDKQFTSGLSELTKGRDELKGYEGQDLHPDDVAFLKTELPAYDKAISDLQTQYKQYQTSVSDLTTAQTDYQKYLGEVQTGQKDYQKYLGEIQTGQKALSDYGTSVRSDLGDLENYATAFSDARKASDEAARSYTVQSQQGIASGLRQGVAGIRAARGYRTVGSNRNKSAKRRWNRDFRIQSFGEGGGVSPINI